VIDPTVEETLQKAGIVYEVLKCEDKFADTAQFCEEYGYSPAQAANTILIRLKTEPRKIIACVISGDKRIDVNKKLCKSVGAKRASFADAEQTKEFSGMAIGGVTVFGLPEGTQIVVDEAVMDQEKVIMGSGNRVSKLFLAPAEIKKLDNVSVADIAFD
jgi:prolyl-tRNA editing enzyme YbaK/EbsC (Cys-tRNA(Pro) deacylase)